MSFLSRILVWLKIVASQRERIETPVVREIREIGRLRQNLIVMQLNK